MTLASRKTGQTGERIAQHMLKTRGFRIEASNWRAGNLGEIDVIAFHPQQRVLAFVEVKSRKTMDYGGPSEAVGIAKQCQLRQLAEIYLAQHPQAEDVAFRFDVISIFYPDGGKAANIKHFENAFQ